MKKKLINALCMVLVTFTVLTSFGGCGGDDVLNLEIDKQPEKPDNQTFEQTGASEDSGNHDETKVSFDQKLISYFEDNTEGSYMVSPLSFRYALGLMLAGAEGETKEELLKAFGVSSEDEWAEYCSKFNDFSDKFAENYEADADKFRRAVEKGIVSGETDIPVRALSAVNSIWKNNNVKGDIKEEFKEYIDNNYGAEYYGFDSENAVRDINNWVREKTNEMIDGILPEGYDAEYLKIVLLNAMYYKDCFKSAFDKKRTTEGNFTTAKGENVTKSFMNQKDFLNHYSDKESSLVIIPMKSGVKMAFVLGSTDDISSKLSKATLKEVDVTIPRIELETTFDNNELKNFLIDNGVQKAFSDGDFSRMTDEKMSVGDIIQKTKIKLNEEGAEAAAATAITYSKGIIEIDGKAEFKADKPFSFFIYTDTDGRDTFLFAGRVTD